MPKEKTNIYNTLNINTLPPPIEEGKDTLATVLQMTGNPDLPDEKLSYYALKLIRRLLTTADADFTDMFITLIKRMLNKQNLSLGSYIRWSPETNEYYIYPTNL